MTGLSKSIWGSVALCAALASAPAAANPPVVTGTGEWGSSNLSQAVVEDGVYGDWYANSYTVSPSTVSGIYDFGSVRTTTFAVRWNPYWAASNGHTTYFFIEASADGSTWTSIRTLGPYTAVGPPYTYYVYSTPTTETFTGSHRYLRIRITHSGLNDQAHTNVDGVRPAPADTTPPSVPGTPAASPDPSAGPVTITWSGSNDDAGGSGVKEYDVTVSSDGGANFSPLVAVPGTSHGYTAPQGSYLYRVRARDNAGNASAFTADSNRVRVDTTPPTVGTPSASPSPNNTGTHTVSWAAADAGGSGLAAIRLERSDDGRAFVPVATLPGTVSSWTEPASGLADGTYVYQVVATDAVGNAATSAPSPAVVVIRSGPTVGTPLVNPSPRSPGIHTLSWTASGTGLRAIQVQRQDAGAPFTVVAALAPTERNWSEFPPLKAGSYVYRVVVEDIAGNERTSAHSAPVEVVPRPSAPAPSTAACGPPASDFVPQWLP